MPSGIRTKSSSLRAARRRDRAWLTADCVVFGCAAARVALLARRVRRSSSAQARAVTPEIAARILEASDDYRILRRLRPREMSSERALGSGERLAVIVDTETTGLERWLGKSAQVR